MFHYQTFFLFQICSCLYLIKKIGGHRARLREKFERNLLRFVGEKKTTIFTILREEATSALAGFHVDPLSWSNWNLEFLCREENRRTRRKTLGARTRTNTLVGGERSHHCVNPAPQVHALMCARANDEKIERSRDAQYTNKELPNYTYRYCLYFKESYLTIIIAIFQR